MREVHPQLIAALAEQLEHRRQALGRGGRHVGWKLGMGDRESINGEIAVGYLTSRSCLDPGSTYVTSREELHADVELAVRLGSDLTPAAYAAALELVDLTPLPNEPYSVVAQNVFHVAVAFGNTNAALPRNPDARLLVNGGVRGSGQAPRDVGERIRAAARILESAGEGLQRDDWIITGSVAQVPVAPGDAVVAELDGLGGVQLNVVAGTTNARA